MKILQYVNAAYTPTAAAVGNIAVAGIPAMAKMADTNVNSLSALTHGPRIPLPGLTSRPSGCS